MTFAGERPVALAHGRRQRNRRRECSRTRGRRLRRGAHRAPPGPARGDRRKAVRAAGGEPLVVPADLGDPAVPAALVDAVTSAAGRLDGIVANAATISHMPLAEWQVGRFDEHVAVNVRAPFFLIQAALLDGRRRAPSPASSSRSARPRARSCGPRSACTG